MNLQASLCFPDAPVLQPELQHVPGPGKCQLPRLQSDQALQCGGKVELHLAELAVKRIVLQLDITGEILGVFSLVVDRIFRPFIEQDLRLTIIQRNNQPECSPVPRYPVLTRCAGRAS